MKEKRGDPLDVSDADAKKRLVGTTRALDQIPMNTIPMNPQNSHPDPDDSGTAHPDDPGRRFRSRALVVPVTL
jgi:hypothetical protein